MSDKPVWKYHVGENMAKALKETHEMFPEMGELVIRPQKKQMVDGAIPTCLECGSIGPFTLDVKRMVDDGDHMGSIPGDLMAKIYVTCQDGQLHIQMERPIIDLQELEERSLEHAGSWLSWEYIDCVSCGGGGRVQLMNHNAPIDWDHFEANGNYCTMTDDISSRKDLVENCAECYGSDTFDDLYNEAGEEDRRDYPGALCTYSELCSHHIDMVSLNITPREVMELKQAKIRKELKEHDSG